MLSAEVVKESIIEVLNDYRLLTEIAINMDVTDVDIKYEDWFRTYPLGIIISELKVNATEKKQDIQKSFVKAMLFDRACGEEWNLDFFDISKAERQELIQLDFYKNMFRHKEMRLKLHSFEEFKKDFIDFAVENGMSKEHQNGYLDKFKDAVFLEIGGCYSGDWEYFVVSEKSVFVVGYGIWD